jgi:CpXC protein
VSRTQSMTVACPGCGDPLTFEAALTVNAARDPDQRAGILDGTFQRQACPCGASVRLDPELSYLDPERRQWLVVQPCQAIGDWPEHERKVQALYDRAFGADAAQASQELGAEISPRVVFGWSALREKLLAREHGLDDATLEFVKLTLMKSQGIVPQPGQELRLTGVDEDHSLKIAVIEAQPETLVSGFAVPREVYDGIASDPETWAALRAPLTSGPFVDAQKLYLGDG